MPHKVYNSFSTNALMSHKIHKNTQDPQMKWKHKYNTVKCNIQIKKSKYNNKEKAKQMCSGDVEVD